MYATAAVLESWRNLYDGKAGLPGKAAGGVCVGAGDGICNAGVCGACGGPGLPCCGSNPASGLCTAPALLDSFLGSVIKNAPNALLVVAQIIPFNGSEKGFNAAIPAIVEKRAKEGAHIIMVDQSAGFTSADIADGVHPNEGGYAKMAAIWYKAIAQHLH